MNQNDNINQTQDLSNVRSYNEQDYLLDNGRRIPKIVYFIAIFSAIGGFLFGYDTGVISGAMLLLKDHFNLSTMWQEAIVSATIASAILFALLGGYLADLIGRKWTILAASLIFTLGSISLATSLTKASLLTGRTILGFGIGLASMSIPMYIAEMSPPELRGRLVTFNNVFVTGGQFIASLIDGIFSYDRINGWRYMLGLAAIPAFIQFLAFIFMPESPRWLIKRGRDGQAKSVLAQISGSVDQAQSSFQQIKLSIQSSADLEQQRANTSHHDTNSNQQASIIVQIFRNPSTRRALYLGCFLQIIQQLCGINTVMYYSATIIEMSGVRDKSMAIWLSAATAFVNFLCTFIGLYLVERVGRRTLTLASLAGVIMSLALLAVGFQLAAFFSPSITYHPAIFANNVCDKYRSCSTCVENRDCGFCYFMEASIDHKHPFIMNGSCLPVLRDPSTQSFMSQCSNHQFESPDPKEGVKHERRTRANSDDNKRRVYMSSLNMLNLDIDGDQNYYDNVDIGNEYSTQQGKDLNVNPSLPLQSENDFNINENDNKLEWSNNYCPTPYYWIPIVGLFSYLFFFAPGMGPMPWTINSEIYPMWARSTGNSIASASNWFSNLLVSMTFLTLTERVGKHVTFWIYTVFACIGFIGIYIWLPETKGKTLEQMENLFSTPSTTLSTPQTNSSSSNDNAGNDNKGHYTSQQVS